MRERTGHILRIVCLVLAAVAFFQLLKIALRVNPLHGVTIPPLPTLSSDTNAPTANKSTNAVVAVASTNRAADNLRAEIGTHAPAARLPKENPANALAAQVAASNNPPWTETNLPLTALTNAPGTNFSPAASGSNPNALDEKTTAAVSGNFSTNVPNGSSNMVSQTPEPVAETNAAGTNLGQPMPVTGSNLTMAATGTNISVSTTNRITNPPAQVESKKKDTNSPAPPNIAGMPAGFNPAQRHGGPAPELPPAVKARVDRIYESELFGQIMHPMPMALLGIAGDCAFLRSPSGQTGLVKEGDSLGEIKLLRIGINRVLVEQDGQKKELLIFDGYGGESLLPKEKENSK